MTRTPDNDDYLDSFLSSAFASTDSAMTSADPELLAEEDLPERLARYPVVERIGRGGVGLVYRVEDPELGRDVAIKVLRAAHARDPELVERFRAEARVCGRLTHPGVVTIHEVGELADGRPYFAMKLIDGATLASMLDGRGESAPTLEMVEIFEKVCQTIAHAHERGVIHGDLKPQNIMVGEFGEVQVMDWGFAKARKGAQHESVGDALASHDDREDAASTRIGGTPAYMAPEQVHGSPVDVSSRTDVFGLGAILCEILTGAPPYLGETREEVFLRAKRGWQDDAVERLEACAADPKLVALARHCLQPDPDRRPESSSAVAREVAAFRSDLERRARDAEIAAAEAHAVAGQERRARLLTVALSATVFAVIIVVAGSILWFQSEAAARTLDTQRVVEAALSEAASARAEASRGGEDEEQHWVAAVAAGRRARDLATSRDAEPDLVARTARVLSELEAESKTARSALHLSERLHELRPHTGDERAPDGVDADYREAFAAVGADIDGEVQEVAGLIRESRLADDLITALDQWAQFRRKHRIVADGGWRRLDELARAADQDEWRNQLRVAAGKNDRRAILRLARHAMEEPHSAESYDLLAQSLIATGNRTIAIDLYRRALRLHPDDYQLNHNLGAILERLPDSDPAEVSRLCWVGAALRPSSAHAATDLARALFVERRYEESIEFGDRAERLRPGHARTGFVRGLALERLGRSSEAAIAYKTAVNGGLDVRLPYAMLLTRLNRLDEALVVMEAAAAARPDDIETIFQHGRVLCACRRLDDGIAKLERVIELDPEHAEARCNLGEALLWRGKFREGTAQLSQGHELGLQKGDAWIYPSEGWVRNARSFARADETFEDWRGGVVEVDQPGMWMSFAMVALRRGLHLTSGSLFLDSLEDSTEPVPSVIYFEAGLAASYLAVADEVEDSTLDDAARASWRGRAIDWFELWVEQVEVALDEEVETEEMDAARRAGLGLVRWSFEPSVRALGAAIMADADEEIRTRWTELRSRVGQLREGSSSR